MRTAEIIVALVLLLLAGVLGWESLRMGIGWTSSGPGAGFISFWLSVAVAVAGLGVLLQHVRRTEQSLPPFFPSRSSLVFWLKILVPMAGVVVLLRSLGIYLVTGLYLALFSAWIGRHRWFVVLGVSLLIPLAMYLSFERFFKLPLPKSFLYGNGLPF
jgi:putative tricarboxylic transport membrane protein